MKQMIRQQQNEAFNKRQMDLIEKQNRARAQIEERLQREAYEQQMYEGEVQRMEKEELELIMRLKNTKLLEEAANQEYDNAKTDPDPQATLKQSQSQTNGKRSIGSRGGQRKYK